MKEKDISEPDVPDECNADATCSDATALKDADGEHALPINDSRSVPAQTAIFEMIRLLTEIGIPRETIREMIESGMPEKLIKLLRKQKEELAGRIRFMREAHSIIATSLDFAAEGLFANESELFVREVSETRIILGGFNKYDDGEGFRDAFVRFCAARHTPELNLAYPIGSLFDSVESFLNAPSRLARFFSYDPVGNERIAGGLYLTGYTREPYGSISVLPRHMAGYAERNGLTFTGSVYNTYLLEGLGAADPEQYLLRVSASVSEARRDTVSHIRHQAE
jgi:hypothetical protein